jgi:hypothetical protein
MRSCRAVRVGARSGGLPDHQDADSDDHQWPDGIEVDVCDTEIFKNKQNSDTSRCHPQVRPAARQSISMGAGGDHDQARNNLRRRSALMEPC